MTHEKHETAIKWLEWEIRSLQLAPEINGCPMTKEWTDQLEIMQTCLEAVKACQPAHIDQEAWKPCKLCEGDELDTAGIKDFFGRYIYLCGGNSKPPENERFQFCPKCGRPRTERTWALLVTPVFTPDLEVVVSLNETECGDNGFGSTGR